MPRRRLRKRQKPGTANWKSAASRLVKGALSSGREGAAAVVATKQFIQAAKALSNTNTKTRKPKGTAPWEGTTDQGIKYHNVTITYKASKIAKTSNKLSQLGTIFQYSATGNASPQGQQANSVAAIVDGSAIETLYQVLNNDTAPPGLQESKKMYYKGTTQTTQFANAGPSTLEFEIYICIDKTTNATLQNPITVWNAAINDEANSAALPVETILDAWNRPTYYKGFNITFWTKRIHCSLTPGEKCEFTFKHFPKRLLDTEYFHKFQSIRGLTYQMMIVQRGTLGDGSQTLTVTAGEQSLTPSKLIWLNKRRMWGSILATLPRVNRQIGPELPTTIGALWAIDEDAGDPENTMLAAEYA